MKEFKYVLFCLLLAIFSSHISCKQCPPQLSQDRSTMVTRQQAVELAKTAFTATGFGKLENFIVAVKGDEDQSKWYVFFDSAAEYRIPGDHLIIYVDKKTGACAVAYGE